MPRRLPKSCAFLLLLLPLPHITFAANFVFPDFNETIGLSFAGSAATTSCEVGIDLTLESGFVDLTGDADKFGEIHGKGDNKSDIEYSQQSEKYTMQGAQTISTNLVDDESGIIASKLSSIGHRDDFIDSKTERCNGRLRLTPSTPHKSGAVWHETRLPLTQGFDTIFTYHISDHSKVCSDHVDPSFSLKHHRTCAVHGGDGFAFVIHGNSNGTAAIGRDGDQLGYGGISNSLAVEFDTWTNVDSQGSSDLFSDHIEIHSQGTGVNSAKKATKFGSSRATPIADGAVHVARVKYLPYFESSYLPYMSASENLLDYVKDNAEGKRLGTLAVFVDEGVELGTPILAIPINLSVLLDLKQNLGYVGFTASTGMRWEKHDVLSWLWCENGNCDSEGLVTLFDYHQTSKFYGARHPPNIPGVGYGAGSFADKNEPTRFASPDTDPWANVPSRKASGYENTLSERANSQVPPHTIE
ncbi:hypothetical protein ScalyP_jg11004 [Parmales sp. scaly parma]|nr:hypothetical protein ScalyP_jg11004 [Parmales sp. scaly parma]